MRALVGTRKGLLLLEQKGSSWKLAKSHFDGVKCSYAVWDPAKKMVWAGLNHGHWGPKLHVSRNKGKSFEEITAPKFPEGSKDSLKDFWALARDQRGRVWLGVEPASLFYSDNDGQSWTLCQGLENVSGKDKWFGGGTDGTCLHSLMVDPTNDDHLLIGISCAGVLQTFDRGATWTYTNKGMLAEFLPDPTSDIGQDPHKVVMSPSNPNVLWQQNHCGLYKSEDMGQSWINLSKARGVKTAFGWDIVVDEEDARVAYTVPAQSDETRIPFKKKLFVQMTKDGGRSWKVLDKGLPKGICYDIVYRHAFALKGKQLMFGSTTGNLYFSGNRGSSWKQFDAHLPPIYSVRLFE